MDATCSGVGIGGRAATTGVELGTTATLRAESLAGDAGCGAAASLATLSDTASMPRASGAVSGSWSSPERTQSTASSASDPTATPAKTRIGRTRARTRSALSAGFPGRISGVRSTIGNVLTAAPHRPQVRSSSAMFALQVGQVAVSETGMPCEGSVRVARFVRMDDSVEGIAASRAQSQTLLCGDRAVELRCMLPLERPLRHCRARVFLRQPVP